jgi:hypothetical protein
MSSDIPTDKEVPLKERLIDTLVKRGYAKRVSMLQLTEGMTPEDRAEFIQKFEEAKKKYAERIEAEKKKHAEKS